jgi:Arc/MetJ family transcription regulator
MMRSVRTTVTIDDELLRQAKEAAARQNRRLGDVIDDALRVLLAERPTTASAVRLTRYGRGGLQPGVDLEDKEAMADLLGDNEPPHAAR